MRLTLKIIITGILLLLFKACSTNNETIPQPSNTNINKILPLGASRVEGAKPLYESYRYELWKDLKENGWNFDFIGTQSDEASYPLFNSNTFDNDHEGRGGWTSEQISNNLNNWLAQTGAPDIVLFSSPAGNDILGNLDYDKAITNINAIIDKLQTSNPNVTIVIEQLAPGKSDFMTPAFTNAFNQMKIDVLTIATNQTTAASKVIAVDMFTQFNDSYLADDIHYNTAGAEFIATRYYNVLKNVLKE